MYTRETRVSVHPFTRQLENGEFIIGRPDTGVFLALPAEAVEVLDELAGGRTVGEAQDRFQQQHGELLDMDDFLGFLEAKGLVHSKNGNGAAAPEAAQRPAAAVPAPVRYHFSNIPQPLAERIFSGPALALYGAILVLAVAAVALEPLLGPSRRSLYFAEDRTLKTFALLVVSYVTVFFHEMGHLVAARARGVNTRLGISHRLWFLVAESDLTGLWSVPKRDRYLPLFAGPIVDAVSSALLVLALFAHHQGWIALPSLAYQLSAAMIFVLVMRIIWQCFFFVRTDFYYVIVNFFNCRNLLKDTEDFLRNLWARILGRPQAVDQSRIPGAEMKIVRAYSIVWLLGRLLAFSLLLFVSVPFVLHYYEHLLIALRNGWTGNEYNFLDALIMAAMSVIPFLLGLGMWLRHLYLRFARRTA